MIRLALPFSLLLATTAFVPALAADTSVRSQFSVYFKGVPVGSFANQVSIKGDRYSISGKAKTNKFISIIAGSKASFAANGRIKGTRLVPNENTYSFKRGKKKGFASLTFQGANVVAVKAQPKPKIKPDTVPLKASHKQNVIDPISTLLFAVKDGGKASQQDVCNRTVPVFDGKNRMDLKFSYRAMSKAKPAGYNGPVFICSVRYVPVAGHRTSSKGTKFMQGRRDITIEMARLGDTDLFGLVAFSVPTRTGIVTGRATSLRVK